MKIYYIVDKKNSLYLRPNGKSTGYIISDTMLGMPVWNDRESATLMLDDLGMPKHGWTVEEGDIESVTIMSRSREKEILDSMK